MDQVLWDLEELGIKNWREIINNRQKCRETTKMLKRDETPGNTGTPPMKKIIKS